MLLSQFGGTVLSSVLYVLPHQLEIVGILWFEFVSLVEEIVDDVVLLGHWVGLHVLVDHESTHIVVDDIVDLVLYDE